MTGGTGAKDPLSAAAVVERSPSIREPRLVGDRLYWLEQRPDEEGRTTLLVAPWNDPVSAEEITPAPCNVRSRVHGYGGGAFSVAAGDLVWVDDADGCLWHLRLDQSTGRPDGTPRRLCEAAPRAFADGLIDPLHQRWIGVIETEGHDQLAAVPLTGGEPAQLHRPRDFCGYPALSSDGRRLAWVEWEHPRMPWERSSLWVADVNAAGGLDSRRRVAGSRPGDEEALSVFQPLWIDSDRLVVASDASGYWNLQLFDCSTGQWRALLPMAAEFAVPQWSLGMRCAAWDGRRLLALACQNGIWTLGRVRVEPAQLNPSGCAWQPLDVPFDDLSDLTAEHGRLVAIGSNATTARGLLCLDLSSGTLRHQPVASCPLKPEAISIPEAVWFAGHGGRATHAWFYPPPDDPDPHAPLLVKIHSGPTSMARCGLNPGIQYWTSRGWGVLDVNYGGSSGFGRRYRERLDGQWGVVDVTDCAEAAKSLVAAGRASVDRIAIEGGSAGGFTTLAALCFTDVFRAGASRYGVADLQALAADTHRFEAGYLDGLVGPLPGAEPLYEARSPLRHAAKIRCPVIFFQGLRDRVVSPEQTDRMAAALQANGLAVEVHRFEAEGHGFRGHAAQMMVLERTERFFRRHLNL
ncbi:MAG: prolyl oligopeptidase family serine peptidase [Cyanobacteriota bacterium]|nr:prolyl oligopeptidase family serine peptidase [Cyanobacteriota bacterium]